MTGIKHWRKPSRSVGQGNCVEIGSAPGLVGIRDTKDRDGGTLVVAPHAFGAFLAAIKNGRVS